jgi:hypothetical protein
MSYQHARLLTEIINQPKLSSKTSTISSQQDYTAEKKQTRVGQLTEKADHPLRNK